MSVNPVYSELVLKNCNTLKSQSIVESRIAEKDSDVVKILSVHSNANLIGSETVAGEVRYSGRVVFSLVYENSEAAIVRSEYGVEFSHKAENASVTSAMSADITVMTENTELKQINGSFVLSAIASANITLVEEETYNYLSSGEGLIVKTDELSVCRRIATVSGGYELFEELETVNVDKVIMHYENAVVTNAQAGVGCVIIDGAANLSIVFLSGGEESKIETLSRLTEFRFEIEADEAMPSMPVTAALSVKGASLTVSVDEAKNKSVIAAEVGIDATVAVYEDLTVNAVTDLYSATNEVTVSAESVRSLKPVATETFSEKYADTAIVAGSPDINDIIGITGESVSLQTTAVKGGAFTVEGVVSALAIVKDSEEKTSTVSLELPFAKELALEGVEAGSSVQVSGLAHSVSARRKSGGEIEMEVSLKINAAAFDYDYLSVITEVSEGDELIKNQSAISVFMPQKGDGLWDVSKRLKEQPEEIMKYNADLEFPLNGDEKIIFYRQEKAEY